VPEYNVHFTGYVSHVETVEADTPEEAIDAAETGSVQLCHQCTQDWDSAGDVEVLVVSDASGEHVWEQEPLAPQPVVDREALRKAITGLFVESDAGQHRLSADDASTIAATVVALINGGAK
jgi:hypothetical protein